MINIASIRKQYTLAIMTGMGVFVLALFVLWMLFARNYAVGVLKHEFSKLIYALNSAGYDIAYDDIDFTSVSPFKIMEISNFRIYAPDNGKYKEWAVPSVKLNASLLDYTKLNISFDGEQTFAVGGKEYTANAQSSDMVMKFDEHGLYNMTMFIKGYQINDVADIKSIKLAIQRQNDAGEYVLENFFDARNISLKTSNTWNMANEIEELYLNFDIKNQIKTASNYQASFNQWLKDGGEIGINKLIIDWKPLVMVARGAVEFDAEQKPLVRLISTSKELLPTLDNLDKAQVIDSKSAFVAKIILAKKSQPAVEGKDYYTIITPVEISSDKITMESIPLWQADNTN